MHPTEALDVVLYYHWIPSELRLIIKNYVVRPLLDNNIRDAAKLWMQNKDQATLIFGPINEWRTELITDMSFTFADEANHVNAPLNTFNDNIDEWDVSNVVLMTGMLQGCVYFNQPLNKWNIRKVVDVSNMFRHCHTFNQPLDNWDTTSFLCMNGMFANAHVFNHSLATWSVGNVMSMNELFKGAHAFNQPLNNWDVSHVESMSCMFKSAYQFNQPLNNWDVRAVRVMTSMFYDAIAFNAPLNLWDPSRVVRMDFMFMKAISFNQSLNDWVFHQHLLDTHNMFLFAASMDSTVNAKWLHRAIADPLVHNNEPNSLFWRILVKWGTWFMNQYLYNIVYVRVWGDIHGFYIHRIHISILRAGEGLLIILLLLGFCLCLRAAWNGEDIDMMPLILQFFLYLLLDILCVIRLKG